MAEEFESLDAAAVAGAHGGGNSLGWGGVPVLLSPVDVFSSDNAFDIDQILLKQQAHAQAQAMNPVRLAPATQTQPSKKRRLSRAEEELTYGQLLDIGGTTAARSRQMTEEERRVMLYKRKLRNRASAARSREKRCRTIRELSAEVTKLLESSKDIGNQVTKVMMDNQRLAEDNKLVRAENERLKCLLARYQGQQ